MASYVDSLARLLDELRTEGAVASSRVSESQREALQSLFTGEILSEEPGGHGHRVIVTEANALKNFIDKRYPSGLKKSGTDHGQPRKSAIKERRDSKLSAKNHDKLHLFRIFENGLLIPPAKEINPLILTREAGCITLSEDLLDNWRYEGVIGTVENYEAFENIEKFRDYAIDFFPRGFIYTGGVISKSFLDWLTKQDRLKRIVHFGDYDPLGLREYLRLDNQTTIDVGFYCPQNLEELFQNYSKRALLKKQGNREIFDKVRSQLDGDKEVAEIINLIEKFNAGLEQEILSS